MIHSAIRSALLGLALIGISACTSPAIQAPAPSGPDMERTEADASRYIEMRDGVKLALNLYFPGGQVPEDAAPAILVQTRYGRARMINRFERFREDGYVIAAVDTRGSTSSFGPRRVDIGPEEVADMEEIIAHLAAQPWSDGTVFAHGTSYMADTADIATSRPAPELKGAIVREVDFDVFLHVFLPGGVVNQWFLDGWGGATRAMDEGRHPDGSLNCLERAEDCPKLWPMLDNVDSDTDYSQLRAALAGRNRWAPEDYDMLVYHDDKGLNGFTFFDPSPASHLEGIRAEAKPAQIWGSWMDAGTARAALSRSLSAPDVPMEIWITANDNPNETFADPRFPGDLAPRPSLDEQHAIMTGFYDRIRAGEPIDCVIHYYVLGADRFETSDTWPPRDVTPASFYLETGNGLAAAMPEPGETVHEVDFTAATGDTTRWSTQFDTAPAYPDRREADEKLAVFDSAPFEAAMEIAGDPVLNLYLASATADPAIFAYLELVAPDGRVSYLTEGTLRAIHRAPADPADLPYDMGARPHSFLRKDSLPVVPGEAMQVSFALNPVAARINAGDRVRIAIAGTDSAYFRQYSEGKDEVFTIYHGGELASALILPLRPLSED